jgi:hypothetical protein
VIAEIHWCFSMIARDWSIDDGARRGERYARGRAEELSGNCSSPGGEGKWIDRRTQTIGER